ncbi:MAG: PAS domain-containing protein [Pseudomonadota bacterium]|nr:PAS domain-containing protein [Pseudomonadota bacterium]
MFYRKLKRSLTAAQERCQALQSEIDAIKSSVAVIEFTADRTILAANELFLKSVGYSSSELIGKKHSELCDPDYARSAAYQQLWKRLQSGESFSGTVSRRRKDGTTIWLEATYMPVKNPDGTVTKIL